MERITKLLLKLKDDKNAELSMKLIPGFPKEYFTGVKIPVLRDIARNMSEEEKKEFLKELPHKYHEENIIHSAIISNMKDYDLIVSELNRFLPYVNCWAVSDTLSPKHLKKHLDKYIYEIKKWIKSKETYKVRFAIFQLMTMYLDDTFKVEHFDLVNSVKSDEYYVKMMVAWYYATALAKQYDFAIKVIESKCLDKWTHNKAIQKALESFRVSDEHKAYLRTLKV